MSNSFPTITSLQQLIPALKVWQQQANQTIALPVAPRSPFNFRATGGATGATGNQLSWEKVPTADGYEIQMTLNGDFSAATTIAAVTAATAHFDSTTVTSIKRWYRIRATSGTQNQPHAVKGVWSAPIISTSGSGVTTYDKVSGSTAAGGWNSQRYPGIGSRRILK